MMFNDDFKFMMKLVLKGVLVAISEFTFIIAIILGLAKKLVDEQISTVGIFVLFGIHLFVLFILYMLDISWEKEEQRKDKEFFKEVYGIDIDSLNELNWCIDFVCDGMLLIIIHITYRKQQTTLFKNEN